MGKLTDKFIINLKPKDKPYFRADGSKGRGKGTGLYIQVYPSGQKIWKYRYHHVDGQPRQYRLGSYAHMGLSEARKEWRKAAAQVDRGVDIVAEREQQRQARKDKITVRILADQFVERYSKPKKRTWKEDQRILGYYVLPRWRNKPIEEIKPDNVSALILTVAEENGGVMSTQVLACVRKMFAWAVKQGLIEKNPAAGVDRVHKAKRRERVLSSKEIRGFWKGVQEAPIPEGASRALRFILLTALRPGEVTAARWEHLEEDHWLNIPQTKSDRSHRVYLTGLALELLGELQESGPIFTMEDGRAIRTDYLPKLTTRYHKAWEAEERWHPHDLRRTAATRMTEAEIVDRFLLKRILNHVDKETAAIYDRASYWRAMARGWEGWSRELTRIIEGKAAEKVVDFPGGSKP